MDYGGGSQKNWHKFWCQIWRSPKLFKNTFYAHFEGFWSPSYEMSKLTSICVNLIMSIYFFFVNLLHSPCVWLFDILTTFQQIDIESFIFMYLGNPNCSSFIWHSYMTPIPLWPLGPQKPWIFIKIWQLFDYFGHRVTLRKILFSISILLGGTKLVKLAAITIKVRVDGQRTTPGNQSRAWSIHLKDPLIRCCLWHLHYHLGVRLLLQILIWLTASAQQITLAGNKFVKYSFLFLLFRNINNILLFKFSF